MALEYSYEPDMFSNLKAIMSAFAVSISSPYFLLDDSVSDFESSWSDFILYGVIILFILECVFTWSSPQRIARARIVLCFLVPVILFIVMTIVSLSCVCFMLDTVITMSEFSIFQGLFIYIYHSENFTGQLCTLLYSLAQTCILVKFIICCVWRTYNIPKDDVCKVQLLKISYYFDKLFVAKLRRFLHSYTIPQTFIDNEISSESKALCIRVYDGIRAGYVCD